jgi:hypothetical protein
MTDLDELERLLAQATPGPWIEMEMHPYLFANPRGPQPWHHDIVGRFDYHSDANRALIAALRNHAEELVRDARRYRYIRDKMNASRNDLTPEHRHLIGDAWYALEALPDEAPRALVDAAIDAAIAQEQP